MPAEIIAIRQNKFDAWRVVGDVLTKKDLLLKWDNGETAYCSSLCVVYNTPESKKYDNDPALIGALQPFARLAETVLSEDHLNVLPDETQINVYLPNPVPISLGDLRNLLTALAKAEGKL